MITVNEQRLWSRLMAMAEIGPGSAGGCNRQALTDEDKLGRDLFVQWCTDAGCSIDVDSMGNVFAVRAGEDNDLPAVMAGSHLDTQPTGGKFDGVYGVLAGLEVIESYNDNDIQTVHPLVVAAWTNEEGARFSPAMIGSGVFAGVFDVKEALAITDKEGCSIGAELARINYDGSEHCGDREFHAAFEVHIEQGPILEKEGKQIGIVNGVQGMRWYDVTLEGEPVHAGPTPMDMRVDPMKALPGIVNRLYSMVDSHGPLSRVTFGDISANPGARNTVPEVVTLAVDLRHPDQAVLDIMDAGLRDIVEQEIEKSGLKGRVRDEWNSPAVVFDKTCVEAVGESVSERGYSSLDMVSGAGHDSVYISRIAPTAMIFIPCEGGISHNEAENINSEDAAAGANVLLGAMLKRAQVVEG